MGMAFQSQSYTTRQLSACLFRYVEMNPVRASIVAEPRQYCWLSYRERMGVINTGLLDLDASYLSLANDLASRIEQYWAYLQQGASDKEVCC